MCPFLGDLLITSVVYLSIKWPLGVSRGSNYEVSFLNSQVMRNLYDALFMIFLVFFIS